MEEQAGLALYPLRSEEEEAEMVEKDLRVIINVRSPPFRPACAQLTGHYPQLDVQIGTLRLQDKLEWDLSSSLTPELFAASLCRDLSLSSNAAPLIAHALHEELIRLKRSCLEIGLLNENDTNKGRRGAKMLEGVWRDWNEAQNFGPKVERLTLDELDKVEQERERANRCVLGRPLSSRRTDAPPSRQTSKTGPCRRRKECAASQAVVTLQPQRAVSATFSLGERGSLPPPLKSLAEETVSFAFAVHCCRLRAGAAHLPS